MTTFKEALVDDGELNRNKLRGAMLKWSRDDTEIPLRPGRDVSYIHKGFTNWLDRKLDDGWYDTKHGYISFDRTKKIFVDFYSSNGEFRENVQDRIVYVNSGGKRLDDSEIDNYEGGNKKDEGGGGNSIRHGKFENLENKGIISNGNISYAKLKGYVVAFSKDVDEIIITKDELDVQEIKEAWNRWMHDRFGAEWICLITDRMDSGELGEIVESVYQDHDGFTKNVKEKCVTDKEELEGNGDRGDGGIKKEKSERYCRMEERSKGYRRRRGTLGHFSTSANSDGGINSSVGCGSKEGKGYGIEKNKVIHGDCKDVLKSMPADYIDLIVTSPPYWNLRDYGGNVECDWGGGKWNGQLGQEPNPDMFVDHLVEAMVLCKRVLKEEGSIWVNIDDKYGEDKSLVGVPERFYLEMLEKGFICRNKVKWAKQVLYPGDDVTGATKPSSAKDRVIEGAYEEFYHFTINGQYYYDLDSIRRPHKTKPSSGKHYTDSAKMVSDGAQEVNQGEMSRNFNDEEFYHEEGGNLPAVWQIGPSRSRDAHFATFPKGLIERPIEACCPKGGIVLDPFAGTGTALAKAAEMGRNYIGIEASDKYVEIARENVPGNIQGKLV